MAKIITTTTRVGVQNEEPREQVRQFTSAREAMDAFDDLRTRAESQKGYARMGYNQYETNDGILHVVVSLRLLRN